MYARSLRVGGGWVCIVHRGGGRQRFILNKLRLLSCYSRYLRMRKRAQHSNDSDDDGDDRGEHSVLLSMSKFAEGAATIPSALDLLQGENDPLTSRGYKSGYLLKEGWNFHGLLSWVPCCGCDQPVYKRRFFVLRGGYLFRYVDEHGSTPKGLPIPVEDSTVHQQLSVSDAPNVDEDNASTTIILRTLRKEYILRARNITERDHWIRQLRSAKQWAIKARMGHVEVSSLDKRIMAAGDAMYKKSLQRERKDAEENMELKMYGAQPGF